MNTLAYDGCKRKRISESVDWVNNPSWPSSSTRAFSSAFFLGCSERQATSAKTVKSPVARKDVSAITPLDRLNLIEVSGNFHRLSGEIPVRGVESIRHAHLGYTVYPLVSPEGSESCSPLDGLRLGET